MDSMQKQRLYQKQLRNLYTQVSNNRNSRTKKEDATKEELTALNIKASLPENMPKELLKRSNVVKKIVNDSIEKAETEEEQENTIAEKSIEEQKVEPMKWEKVETLTEEETKTEKKIEEENEDRKILEENLKKAIMTSENEYTKEPSEEIKMEHLQEHQKEEREKLEEKLRNAILQSEYLENQMEEPEKSLFTAKASEETIQDGIKEKEVGNQFLKTKTIEEMEQERMNELQDVIEEKFPNSKKPKTFKEAMEIEMAKYENLQFQEETKVEQSSKVERKSKKEPFFQRIKQKAKTFAHTITNRKKESAKEEIPKKSSFFQKAKQKVTSLIHSVKLKPKISTRLKAAIAAIFILVTGTIVHFANKNEGDKDFHQANKSITQAFDKDMSADLEKTLSLGQLAKMDIKENVYTIDNTKTQKESEPKNKVETKSEDKMKPTVEVETEKDNLSESEEDKLLLGKSIKLNEDINVYMTEQDAYMEENGLSSYYSNDDERVIIGVLISDGTSMMRICADKEDANKVINTALENNGEVLSILTANKAYVLSDYDGTKKLSAEDINASAEGWYNAHDVTKENVKTLRK